MKPKRSWRPPRRKKNTSVDLPIGSEEVEFGIPIAGKILPQEMWTHCALKKLPESRPVDWNEVFSRQAPLVVDIGCGNGRYSDCETGAESFGLGCAADGDSIWDPTRESTRLAALQICGGRWLAVLIGVVR